MMLKGNHLIGKFDKNNNYFYSKNLTKVAKSGTKGI